MYSTGGRVSFFVIRFRSLPERSRWGEQFDQYFAGVVRSVFFFAHEHLIFESVDIAFVTYF